MIKKGGVNGITYNSYTDFVSIVDSPDTRSQTMSIYTTDAALVDSWYFSIKEVDAGNKDPNGSGLTSD